MEAYGAFAQIYDRLMDDFNYPAWAAYYQALLNRAGVSGGALLETACGTGSMTAHLSDGPFVVTASDISQDMLRVAAEKMRKAGADVRLVCQDMTKIFLPRPVDALVCACDGVNYLTTLARVGAFFQSAHSALRPGGALAFDISSRDKIERVLAGGFFGEERDDIAYLWSNAYDARKRILTMDITFFLRERDGRYKKVVETHRQRAHDAEEITKLLADNGFETLGIFGDGTFAPPQPHEGRMHFLARRL